MPWTRSQIRTGVHRYTSGAWTITAVAERPAVEGAMVYGQQTGSTRTRIREWRVERDGEHVFFSDTLADAKRRVERRMERRMDREDAIDRAARDAAAEAIDRANRLIESA